MDSEEIMQEFIRGTGIVCLYYALAASTAFVSRKLIRIPDELFRKILHFILQISYIFIAYAFETWWLSVLFGFLMLDPKLEVGTKGGKLSVIKSCLCGAD